MKEIGVSNPWPDLPALHHWKELNDGLSGAWVFRIQQGSGADLILKSEEISTFSELEDEADRLKWLQKTEIPAAKVLRQTRHAGRNWLLMTAVAGRDLSSDETDPFIRTSVFAGALRRLHAVPVISCPFDHRADRRIALALKRAAAGKMDWEDLDDENRDLTPEQLATKLQALRPQYEDLVVTHGDACLPNLMIDEGRFSGFIDCGRLGIADRHQDLALACRDIAAELGQSWIGVFLGHYGMPINEEKARFYRLLDEFF